MNKKKTTMPQKHYSTIEIDGSEKDIVQIIMLEQDPQIVHVERENIERLILLLQTELPEKKVTKPASIPCSVKDISQAIANAAHMPYCWQDVSNRLQSGIALPFKLKDSEGGVLVEKIEQAKKN